MAKSRKVAGIPVLMSAVTLAYDDFDPERIATFLHRPCLMVNRDYVATLATEHAILSNVRMLTDFGSGWKILVSTTHFDAA